MCISLLEGRLRSAPGQEVEKYEDWPWCCKGIKLWMWDSTGVRTYTTQDHRDIFLIFLRQNRHRRKWSLMMNFPMTVSLSSSPSSDGWEPLVLYQIFCFLRTFEKCGMVGIMYRASMLSVKDLLVSVLAPHSMDISSQMIFYSLTMYYFLRTFKSAVGRHNYRAGILSKSWWKEETGYMISDIKGSASSRKPTRAELG